MTGLRIIIAHNTYQHRGGEDAVVESEMALLRYHGHEVITYFRNNDDISSASAISTAMQTLWSSRTVDEFSELIHSFRPDIIHVHNTFPLISPSLYWAATQANVPVILTLHNFRLMCLSALYLRNGKVCEDCAGRLPWLGVVRRCYRDSVPASTVLAGTIALHRGLGTYRNKVSRYIALTEFAKLKFITGGLQENNIRIKPNFIEDPFKGQTLASSKQAEALFVGRFSQEKGISVLLQAWKSISYPLQLAGNGPIFDQCKATNKHGDITFLGLQSNQQIHELMSKARFLIMPSIWHETFGLVLIEAFAHGMPVICSRLGAMAEIVEDHKTGLHFDAGNADDLARKVNWMLAHPEECVKMGENARAVYLEKYTPEINYQHLMSIYQEAINEA